MAGASWSRARRRPARARLPGRWWRRTSRWGARRRCRRPSRWGPSACGAGKPGAPALAAPGLLAFCIMAEHGTTSASILLVSLAYNPPLLPACLPAPPHPPTHPQVYESLMAEGYRVTYARIPLTDGACPLPRDFDAFYSSAAAAGPSDALIYTCQVRAWACPARRRRPSASALSVGPCICNRARQGRCCTPPLTSHNRHLPAAWNGPCSWAAGAPPPAWSSARCCACT